MSAHRLQTQSAANDTQPLTYILAKDETVQIAVPMTDGLHALCWGRLWLSTEPHPVPVIDVADPQAWVREQRVAMQVSTKDRLAALRASWAPAMQDAA